MSISGEIPRLLELPNLSFFLFGPRGTGKSTWLRQRLGEARTFDLLDSTLFLELSKEPHRLESLVGREGKKGWIVLDEIQKTPQLLDEVQRLMSRGSWLFALCGSSARKLKRGGANLLAGRAITLSMEGFSAFELKDHFDLDFAIQWGTLPYVWKQPEAAADILAAYVNTYLKEELQAEGIIRRAPPFLRFLAIAGQFNGQALNLQNIARDAAVPRSTVEVYFSVLVDTLIGHFLPPWRPGLKVREAAQPKFYWFDPGVARAAAGLLAQPADRIWQGLALETLVYHELRVYNQIRRKRREIYYYQTPAGVEIDFLIATASRRPSATPGLVLIEVKRAEKWERAWEKPMRLLAASKEVVVEKMIGVYCGQREYDFDGVLVLPFENFVRQLYQGKIF
jgi:predicted AAA+ superfamily ATPase